MRKVTLLIFNALLYTVVSTAQTTFAELYNNKDYLALSKLGENDSALNGEELYRVGYAFFQLEKDEKAVEFYDKAIAKGHDNGPTRFFKGVSLTYLQKYDEALKEIDLALKKEPNNQEYMNQKGLIYRSKGMEDKALDYFEEATRYPNTYGEPFFWVAYIYHGKQDLEKALKSYYIAAEKVPQHNSYYITTLLSIGQLEYTFTQNYKKSALAYAAAIALKPEDYKWYPKLIKAYNAAKDYAKADEVFKQLQTAYTNKELQEGEWKSKLISIDECEWKKQKLNVFKSIEDPKKVLDVMYRIHLLDKTGDKIERVFTVEKTIQTAGGNKHLLCEQKSDLHFTYPYGWKTDAIPLEDLKKAVALILDGKLQHNATSSPNGK